jgi:adenylate cyclase
VHAGVLHMPEMDGFEVMQALRNAASENYIPVLAITSEAELKLRALRCGARDFIGKPFELV